VTTFYVRSSVLGGQVIAELNGSGTWTRGYVYLGGQMLAIQNGAVNWVHQDPVTKSQRVTNSSGAVISTIDLDPWGGETNRSANSAFQPHKYTSYERDGNGGDDAMMRRYQSNWSRFSQPDPYDGSYSLTNPQSLNRYSYTQNDPVNFVDPTGLVTVCIYSIRHVRVGDLGRDVLVLEGCFDVGGGGGSRGPVEPRGGGGGRGGGQPPAPTKPAQQQPKSDCKQDKTGGDRGDIEDLLGRAGLSDSISSIQSAGPKNPEGITFDISNRQAFLAILDADPRFRHGTPFGGEHRGQVSGNIFNTLDYRSFTTSDGLGIDSHGFSRSLQVDVGPVLPGGRVFGYADLDCDNPAQDVVSGARHGFPIIFRRLGGLFGR
jgi:RHS repeat-associated protein